MKHLLGCFVHVDTVSGPWASLGVHVDWQAPHVTLHFWNWIITVGKIYPERGTAKGRSPLYEQGMSQYMDLGDQMASWGDDVKIEFHDKDAN